MKYKHLIAVYLLGTVIGITGAMFKIIHWPYATLLPGLSAAIQVAIGAVGIVKVLRDNDAKSFLNR